MITERNSDCSESNMRFMTDHQYTDTANKRTVCATSDYT